MNALARFACATMVSFRIGVAKGKTITPYPYRVPDAKPIVHYGTSVVHGGCASHPRGARGRLPNGAAFGKIPA